MDNEKEARPNAKARLLTLDDLDRRTRAATVAIEARDALLVDLGGAENCTAAERELVQRAAVIGAIAMDVEVRYLKGAPIEVADYLAAVNAQRRVLATLGLERRQRDVTPDLDKYLAERADRSTESSTDNFKPHSQSRATPGQKNGSAVACESNGEC